MPSLHRLVSAAGLVVAMAAVMAAGPATPPAPLQDVLDTPSAPSARAQRTMVSSLARRGDRLVGVGPRGLVLLSVDGGGSWKQVPAPVSADLVSVKFAAGDTVWAVGHDAVALRSVDAGATWERVLDGRSVLKLLRSTYGSAAQAGDARAKGMLDEFDRAMEQSATPGVLPAPFLDVWFGANGEGYLVGAFGLILRTADHGKTWAPWIEHVDNDSRFHLYGVSGTAERLYVAGEQGLLLRLDRQQGRFVKVDTPYKGTYFGVDVQPGRLLAYGLRGNVYLSRNDGQQWDKVDTGIDAHIVAAVNAGDDRLLLVSQAGHVLALKPGSLKVQPLQVPFTSEVLSAVAAGSKGLVFGQINGIRVVELMGYSLQ